MGNDSLGDRIKRYEDVTRNYLCRRMPAMVRVDGRAFHTFTKGMERPFDANMMEAMDYAARAVIEDMQGFKAAYIQSDEVTFLMTDYDDINTQGWFDYNISKIISLSASIMSVYFNSWYRCYIGRSTAAVFDSRVFNVPQDDVSNAFLWRSQDWERNSLQMYCQSIFSHKQLHKKNKPDMHEMLHDVGKNWTKDLTERQKNGTWLLNIGGEILRDCTTKPNFIEIDGLINKTLTPE